jgi:hypothetical protein
VAELLVKYPDEDQIEKVLDTIYSVAWENKNLTSETETKLLENIRWMLNIWNKNYIGNNRLSQIIEKYYLSKSPTGPNKILLYKELDLVICFFQHYIYAFEEFMNRGFRDCVIRCGLICERFVKRLAVADNHREILEILKFEDRANRLMSLLEDRCDEMHFLIERMKSIYSKRTKRGAHDTGAAGMLVSKSCISQIPIAYMEYFNSLEKIGYSFWCKDELLSLVNSTVSIGTTLIVTKTGKPTTPESVLTSFYRQEYFASTRTFAEVQSVCKKTGYVFPKASLWSALNTLCRQKILTKPKRNCYVQRMPPKEYFAKELIE